MNVVIFLLVIVIVLQFVILYSIRKSLKVQIAIGTEVGKALDWVDSGLANSLDQYRGFGE